MKLRNLIAASMCLLIAAASALTALAAPDDGDYLDDLYSWASSTVSDIIDGGSGDTSSDGVESDYNDSEYTSSGDDDSWWNTESNTEQPEYAEPETQPYAPETEPEAEPETYADSSSEAVNWYDWFTAPQEETEPETDVIIENVDDSSKPGTAEYIGYGLLMWIVIIVGGIITIGILTNTHIRKKS